MIEKSQHECQPILKLSFGSVVTLKDDPNQHCLILDTKGVNNIHGSLLHTNENGRRYILAGEGGTMSISDFGQFIRQFDVQETMAIIELGWEIKYGNKLPEDLKDHFLNEAKAVPLDLSAND